MNALKITRNKINQEQHYLYKEIRKLEVKKALKEGEEQLCTRITVLVNPLKTPPQTHNQQTNKKTAPRNLNLNKSKLNNCRRRENRFHRNTKSFVIAHQIPMLIRKKKR